MGGVSHRCTSIRGINSCRYSGDSTSFHRSWRLRYLLSKIPEGFTALQNEEYNLAFLFAFFIYNTVFIGGNWAYVQRYTSVSSPINAKKVAYLFGCLYLIAPIVWMIPPMIYRVLVPELSGGETESAYLLISKLVLPSGLLGLVLGAMIFATASSVNTTLNIASGVITNDLYKLFKPQSSQIHLMRIARASTVVFGLCAIAIALSIKSMGGIVEVVLTVAALTGAPIYLPPIWALFSTRQNGFSIVATTIVSLAINLFFKFVAPATLGIELSRSEEMLVGVMTPVLFLIVFEFILKPSPLALALKEKSKQQVKPTSIENTSSGSDDSNFGRSIIYIGIFGIGMLIMVIGGLASKGSEITLWVGAAIALPMLILLKPMTFISKQLSIKNSRH